MEKTKVKKVNLSDEDLKSFSRLVSYLYDIDIKVKGLEYTRRKPGPKDNQDVDEIIDIFIDPELDENDA